MKVKCIGKERDSRGKIKLYKLEDENGLVSSATANEIREKIIFGDDYEFTNLQIDKIGRLVDKKEKQQTKVKVQENKKRYTLLAEGIADYTGSDKCEVYYKVRDKETNIDTWVNRDELRPNSYSKFNNLSIRKNGQIIIKEEVPRIDISSILYVYMSIKNNVDLLLDQLLDTGGFICTWDGKIVIKNGEKGANKRLGDKIKKLQKTLEGIQIDDHIKYILGDAVFKLYDQKSVYYGYVESDNNDIYDTYLSYSLEEVITYLTTQYAKKLRKYKDILDVVNDYTHLDYKLFAEECKDSEEQLKEALKEVKDKEIERRFSKLRT
ncbi:MAG: hypothetical protein HDR05_12615 [Lachnospiraceae bacterium]|nr:hypothetical protein [Lachnospiraceae bacterium]